MVECQLPHISCYVYGHDLYPYSSTGQSSAFLKRRLQVRVLLGMPDLYNALVVEQYTR